MRDAIRLGLLAGLGLSSWTFLEFLLGLHGTYYSIGLYTGLFGVVLLLLCIWLLIRRFHRAGQLDFEAGLTGGLVLSVIAAAVYGLFLWLYNDVIHPEWAASSLEQQVQRMKADGLDAEEVKTYVKNAKQMAEQSFLTFIYNFISLSIMGTAASAAFTLIWQRR